MKSHFTFRLMSKELLIATLGQHRDNIRTGDFKQPFDNCYEMVTVHGQPCTFNRYSMITCFSHCFSNGHITYQKNAILIWFLVTSKFLFLSSLILMKFFIDFGPNSANLSFKLCNAPILYAYKPSDPRTCSVCRRRSMLNAICILLAKYKFVS